MVGRSREVITLLYWNGFRFFFYSNENDEPIHVHVSKGDFHCKIWLESSVELAYARGGYGKDVNRVTEVAEQNAEFLILKWNEFFRK